MNYFHLNETHPNIRYIGIIAHNRFESNQWKMMVLLRLIFHWKHNETAHGWTGLLYLCKWYCSIERWQPLSMNLYLYCISFRYKIAWWGSATIPNDEHLFWGHSKPKNIKKCEVKFEIFKHSNVAVILMVKGLRILLIFGLFGRVFEALDLYVQITTLNIELWYLVTDQMYMDCHIKQEILSI